ncbi:prepilin-type N-terminal cleavage/methylation domain-containing protein [Phragmitibacter flavus]|uniref:prepilin-type N-terminal cleavage/methylation domain-containing protein n=1 Tax=Phragmitibacter flavus TaxID=2576071 RepID=UPI001408D0CE|nr:prepilin-type N-terminal cleavage/methylation domain-containing protein [Phragmitibacter flavus]
MRSLIPAFRSCRTLPKPRGYTLVEILVVIGIISVLMGTVVNIPGILTTNRRVSALQEIAAVLEQARSQALRGNGTIYVAFSPLTSSGTLEPCRQYAMFEEPETPGSDIRQIGEWRSLPDGLIFHPDATAAGTPGTWSNLYKAGTEAEKAFKLFNQEEITMPTLGFGSLGEVVFPGEGVPGPFAIVLAEGAIDGTRASVPNAHSNLSLEVRRSSGKTLLNPGAVPAP